MVPFSVVDVSGCKQGQLLLIPAPAEPAWSLKLGPKWILWGLDHHIFAIYFYKPTNGHSMLQRGNQPLSWSQCHFHGETQAFGCSSSNGKTLLSIAGSAGAHRTGGMQQAQELHNRRPLRSLLCDLEWPIAFKTSFKVQNTETELFGEIVFFTRVVL